MISIVDVTLIVVVYAIVLLVIGISEYARKRFNLRATTTRHAIHLLAGDNMLLLPFFSALYYPLLIPFGLALLTIYSFLHRRTGIMSRTMIDDKYDRLHKYGPLYYIVAIAILVITVWNMRHLAMAAVMIMAWGDGSASVLGPRFKYRHTYPHSTKSLEGSFAMLVFSTLGAFLAMTVAVQTGIVTASLSNTIILSLAGAVVGTVVEACTVGRLKPFDNFTVPLSAALAIYLVFLVLP
jgi:phytol kinase